MVRPLQILRTRPFNTETLQMKEDGKNSVTSQLGWRPAGQADVTSLFPGRSDNEFLHSKGHFVADIGADPWRPHTTANARNIPTQKYWEQEVVKVKEANAAVTEGVTPYKATNDLRAFEGTQARRLLLRGNIKLGQHKFGEGADYPENVYL